MKLNSTNNHYRLIGDIDLARLTLGLSQQQLADALGVSRSLVAMIETGKRKLPQTVKDVHQELLKQAVIMNRDGYVVVKRGRKPKWIAEDRVFKTVTNLKNHEADFAAGGQAGEKQFVTTLAIAAPPPKTQEAVQREQVIEHLKVKKNLLAYQYTGLEFKEKAIEKRRQTLEEEMLQATQRRDANEKLAAKQTNAADCKKYKKLAKFYDWKQYRLEKKYGHKALLSNYLEMFLLKTTIENFERGIIKLEIEARKAVEMASVPLLPAFPAMEQRVCA